jgi:hypothetical protein
VVLYSTDASSRGRHGAFDGEAVRVRAVDRHLEPAPDPIDDDLSVFDDRMPTERSAWWRWVAVAVVVALVLATPFVYALSRVLH